ncbi:uncharacterized protein LOC125531909 isoform X1 [Triticum urartu]|nr:uncharacterized protein LOC125531909 isoform X1 [Triticum urartu]
MPLPPPRKTESLSEGGAPWPVLTSSVQIQLQQSSPLAACSLNFKTEEENMGSSSCPLLCSYANALLQDHGSDARRSGRQPLPCKQRYRLVLVGDEGALASVVT